MFEIGYISALVGGLLTFLAPCTLPLIPAYISFLAGTPQEGSSHLNRKHILFNGLLFTVGFSVIFIFFGLISGTIGEYFVIHRAFISQIGGAIIFLFGLSMIGAFNIPQFALINNVPKILKPGKPFSAFLLGLLFALGWSPCLGPILGTILVLAGASGTAFHGALLLSTYSLGLAIPFLIIAFVYGASFSYIPALVKVVPYIKKIGGLLFVLIGVLMFIGDFGLINDWVSKILGNTWYNSLMEYM